MAGCILLVVSAVTCAALSRFSSIWSGEFPLLKAAGPDAADAEYMRKALNTKHA